MLSRQLLSKYYQQVDSIKKQASGQVVDYLTKTLRDFYLIEKSFFFSLSNLFMTWC